MDRRRLLIVAALAIPLGFAWWSALVPVAAQAARCAGLAVPWEQLSSESVPCDDLFGDGPMRVPMQATNTPTITPTSNASPTVYVSPTRPPGQTFTPTATGQAGATTTQTATPTRTSIHHLRPASVRNTATRTAQPGTPTVTTTRTATASVASGSATATRAAFTPSPTVPPTRPANTGSPTATVGLPKTGDGSFRGENGGPSAGFLALGIGVAAFSVALLRRFRRGAG
ncbi:MAG: hypothetical protein U0556_19130 [Dehalococcoidia bacterium]